MGLVHHPDPELRDLLQRTVAERWPGERLLMVAPCFAERTDDGVVWPRAGRSAVASDLPTGQVPTVDHEPGVLGVTELRLVYQRQVRHGVPLRLSALVFAAIGLVAIASGKLIAFVVAGVVAGGLGLAARIVESAAMGERWLAFHQIDDLDPERREIRGRGRGRRRRFWIRDPNDFRAIHSLVFRPPAGSFGS